MALTASSDELLEILAQERSRLCESLGIEELRTAMFATGNDDKTNGALNLPIPPIQFLGLFNRGLWILIAVEKQQWRITLINMQNGAGEFSQLGLLFRLTLQEQLQRRDSNFQTVRRGL
jgi:hypothetical protein